MKSLNVHETKTRLSAVLQQIEHQHVSFVICRNGKPVADLSPHVTKNRLTPDPFLRQVKVKCNLTEPLTEADWENA